MVDIISSVIDATMTLLGTLAALGSGMVMLLSMSSTVSAADLVVLAAMPLVSAVVCVPTEFNSDAQVR